MKMIIVGFVTAVVVLPTMPAQTDPARAAVPLEPIAAIIETFRTHQLVVLGEDHRNSPDQAFRLSLVRDPRFPDVVNDIVVESGSAAFQDLMDRFMSGEDVPGESLREVWLNALSPFRAPMYEEFFRAVRAVNDSTPVDRRIRVLLGEAPDHKSRDAYVADIIRREVLDKHRRALVIYGNGHTTRRHPIFRDDVAEERTFVAMIEALGQRVVSVWAHSCSEMARLQPSVASWRRPSLTMVSGTVLGMADYYFYSPIQAWRLAPKQRRMEELVDAVLCREP
jgi:hypothetical protein